MYREKPEYVCDECPRLMFDGRMHQSRYRGVYHCRPNIIALKPDRYKYIKWNEDEFLITYLHELAHWATWLGASKYERRQMHIMYGTVKRKNVSHNDRFIEKIAFWICGSF